MTKWNETRFTKELVKMFKAEGYLVHKSSERFKSGWPDLVVIRDGMATFIEVKVDKNEPTMLQVNTLREIVRHGAKAMILSWQNKTKTINKYQIKSKVEDEKWERLTIR